MASFLTFVNSQSDLESIKSSILQAMDTPSKRLRLAAANALASLYLSVRADNPIDALADNQVAEPKKKRPTPSIKDEEEEPDGRASPVPGKSAAIAPFRIDFREILRQLSVVYARSSSKYVRTGIIQTYSVVLKTLGAEFIKFNYSIILEHLLTEVSPHPLVVTDRYRSIESRGHIQFLLGHVIRRQLLDERGKMTAVRVLADLLDQKTPTKGSKADGLLAEATISAITELSGLVQDLGSAVSFEQVANPLQPFCNLSRMFSSRFLRNLSSMQIQLFRQSLRGDFDCLSWRFRPNLSHCFHGPSRSWRSTWPF
jgi:HEAT repeat-containing protein 5